MQTLGLIFGGYSEFSSYWRLTAAVTLAFYFHLVDFSGQRFVSEGEVFSGLNGLR